MWVFTPTAYVSLVEHRDDSTILIARARFVGDLERLFPGMAERVVVTPEADYRYRLEVHRRDAANAIAGAVLGVDYPNFKGEADRIAPGIDGHRERVRVLHKVWSHLVAAQVQAYYEGLDFRPRPGVVYGEPALRPRGRQYEDPIPVADGCIDCAFCGDQPDLCDCGHIEKGET